MKKKFSKKWKSSKQPRKQRKYRANAPLHVRRKIMSAHLSKDLGKKYKKRSFPVRKGDKVKVLRGKHKGTIGKIEEIDRKRYKVFVQGAEKKKKEGQKIRHPLSPSNLLILSLDTSDKKRVKALERK
ncbi:50S ribosomal protein L24 [Candidatus Woesearchaeota archaeon]|nr:50S ribosomal protein L24 [Candidatus Woesearchaeota archaeon]